MASCSKKRKNEGTKESCCFGKYLQEECHQKTKVEIRLFSECTEKDKTVNKWRAGITMTEDSVTTSCRYHQLFHSDLFFQKNTADVATSTTVTKRKRSQMGHKRWPSG